MITDSTAKLQKQSFINKQEIKKQREQKSKTIQTKQIKPHRANTQPTENISFSMCCIGKWRVFLLLLAGWFQCKLIHYQTEHKHTYFKMGARGRRQHILIHNKVRQSNHLYTYIYLPQCNKMRKTDIRNIIELVYDFKNKNPSPGDLNSATLLAFWFIGSEIGILIGLVIIFMQAWSIYRISMIVKNVCHREREAARKSG